jgi:hypothetical protein
MIIRYQPSYLISLSITLPYHHLHLGTFLSDDDDDDVDDDDDSLTVWGASTK